MASFQFGVRVRTAAVLVAFSAVAVLGASSLVAGCSSSSSASTPDAASQVCPTTVPNALSTPACSTDREVCIVGFVCPGELNEVATCTCSVPDGGGAEAWACTDHTGAPITDPTLGTTCTALGGGNDSQCPADENSTEFAGCKTPGLICTFPGATCPGVDGNPPVVNTDTCQCNGAGDGGLQFTCEPNTCPAPATDAGPIDGG